MSTVTQTDDRYIERSITVCEEQLKKRPFTEPLDAYQIQQLTNMEYMLSTSGPQGYDLKRRISAIIDDISPWLARKDELVTKAKDAATYSNNDHVGTVAATTTSEAHGEAAGEYVEQRKDAFADAGMNNNINEKLDDMPEWSAQGRRESLAAKREELLGEAQSLRRRGMSDILTIIVKICRVVPDSVEGVERLLKSQRETHEDLTWELAKMSGVLKANSMAFGSLVEGDKELVEETSEMLGRSASGVGTQGMRLNKYRKRAWGTTGMTWLAVLVVVAVFFMLVLFMRVAPKRY
ncbi:hypothetical protein COEREDRAFT_86858 [Coemansia reversa NRRL 1564]|uniref:t-SNARE coiled-coil homology domain-containing protein n=1 Tax=Coemansia reversa (strain ATCC 12441 / NRRL 1564) TaxID=763665 RepID=A0A2G5BBT3_COERN|nr:hypothetical protein COEREDRAFT_86858 [Coemansia reversa NRRL 1564]|eukprot:PIA16452.1 hypothetical protein COEREDRAFT_86858 [Coemansia reversa NRRL 1564]